MASNFPEAETKNNSVEVDSVSSDIATGQKKIKEVNVGEGKKGKCEAMPTLKKTIVVSAIVVVVAAAAFAITKKLREK